MRTDASCGLPLAVPWSPAPHLDYDVARGARQRPLARACRGMEQLACQNSHSAPCVHQHHDRV